MRRIGLAVAALAAGTAQAAHVPFVGCPSDGQGGPVAPPAAGATPDIPPAAAAQLAYYAVADGPAVLAPRGWHCFGSYGSNGAALLVAPRPLDWRSAVLTQPFRGPAVQLTLSNGGTSGRFEVADVAARLFPAARAFVDRVEAEGMLDHRLVRAPYPADRITRSGPYRARYTTPANARGLGNEASRLARGPLPIDGVAIYRPAEDDSLTLLAARLPSGLRPLAASIVADVGRR